MKTAINAAASPLTERNSLVLALGLLVAVTTVVFRTGILTAQPEFDELYHLLAARSWNEVGSLAILDGEYTRGAYYTKAVAATMALLGADDLTTARIFSLIMGALTPVMVFLGVYRLANLATALIVAVYLILWPQGILESQSLRFYGLQVLTFLVGAYAFYRASEPQTSNTLMWAILCVLFWVAAFHFQITSIVGIAGAFAGLFCILVVERTSKMRSRLMIFGGAVFIGLIAIALAYQTGLLQKAWNFYRWTPDHALATKDYIGFYHKQFENRYGLMWWSIPVWIGIALYARPRLTFYAMAIFFTCFFVHSFSGMKSPRYLSYASPMLFLVWGISFVWLWEQAAKRIGPKLSTFAAAVTGIALLALSDFPERSYDFARGEGFSAREDWREVRTTLDDWIQAPFIATTRELHMAAYIGDFDVIVSRSRVSELTPPTDFTEDFRTGRITIGSAESVAAILACQRDGLMVTTEAWWAESPEGQTFQTLLVEAGLESQSRLSADVIAVRWTDPIDKPADCRGVPSG